MQNSESRMEREPASYGMSNGLPLIPLFLILTPGFRISNILYPLSFLSTHAMFSPRKRIVFIPSSSRSTSPMFLPIPMFQ